jgi:threonine/homoserine/homoserine lactone efflux protein
MSLAMSLGMTIGLKKTLWMMLGELIGVAIVVVCAVLGVASVILKYPAVFEVAKVISGAYIIFVGARTWRTKVEIESIHITKRSTLTPVSLINKGLLTAVLNPKGWAFTVSLLPPFFDLEKPLALQLSVFLMIILVSELLCMFLYASGGRGLRKLLNSNDKAQYINKIGGILLIGVGLWLAFL